MSEKIILNGTSYEIQGGITEHSVSPWNAKISSGSTEYSDFSQASLEEWHDFRGGIGLQSALPDESARIWWSEGVDVTSSRSAVLGAEVNVAGQFGIAPIKILDFMGHTYAIGSQKISRWDTSSSAWTELAEPTALAVEDCEDAWDESNDSDVTAGTDATWYKAGTYSAKFTVTDTVTAGSILATEVISKNLTTYSTLRLWIKSARALDAGALQILLDDHASCASPTKTLDLPALEAGVEKQCDLTLGDASGLGAVISIGLNTTVALDKGYVGNQWVRPTSHTDADTDWGDEDNAYDNRTLSKAQCTNIPEDTWSGYLELTPASAITLCTKIRFYASGYVDGKADLIDIDLYYDSAWNDLYEGTWTDEIWVEKAIGSTKSVSKARVRFYGDGLAQFNDAYLHEFAFWDTYTREQDIIMVDKVEAIAANALTDPLDAIVVKDGTARYFIVSNATMAIYSTDGTTWSNLADIKGHLGVIQNRLFSIEVDGGKLWHSPANDIDDTATSITLTEDMGVVHGMFTGKNLSDETPTLYVHATKGLWNIYLDSTIANSVAYRQEINYPPLDDAGRAGVYQNANMWIATGSGIKKVGPSRAQPVGPNKDDGLPSGYQGNVWNIEGIDDWIVYCVNGGTTDKSSIFKRNTNYGGNLQIYTTSAISNQIKCVHYSPSSMYTNGRLWWGEGTSVKYVMFPDTTSNPKQISDYAYVEDSGKMIFPKFRRLAAISKTALGVALITKSCNDNEYITLYHDINDTGSWTEMGTYKTSPRPTILTFNSGLGTEFYTIQFAVELERGTTTTLSPELESLMFYYLPRPSTISAWTFRVECAREDSQSKIDTFRTLRDTKTLVVFNSSGNPEKTSLNYNVALSNMPLRFSHEEGGGAKGTIQVTVEQVFEG